MNNFSKTLVKNREAIDAIMEFKIGNSWNLNSQYITGDPRLFSWVMNDKYPISYPALLVIDEDNKSFSYVYESDFIDSKDCLSEFESFKYHSLCARATLYPGKSIKEVEAILDSTKDTFDK